MRMPPEALVEDQGVRPDVMDGEGHAADYQRNGYCNRFPHSIHSSTQRQSAATPGRHRSLGMRELIRRWLARFDTSIQALWVFW
jgi:hypothetical protein